MDAVTVAKRIKDAATAKRQRLRQPNIAANEAVLMSEEEAWRHIQDQDLGGEDEDEGEDPTERQQRGRHGAPAFVVLLGHRPLGVRSPCTRTVFTLARTRASMYTSSYSAATKKKKS